MRMLQLNPEMKASALPTGPYTSLFNTKFLPKWNWSSMALTNKFPFREAMPVYLKSQIKPRMPSTNQFLTHNVNKYLKKYGKPRNALNRQKRKNMEALMLKGLRDVILGYRAKSELISLQSYWLYKVSDYLANKIIAEHSLQFPRLKEFTQQRIYGVPQRSKLKAKIVEEWKSDNKKLSVENLVKKQYRPALRFLKRSLKNKSYFVQMNLGGRKYEAERKSNLLRSSILLNLVNDIMVSNMGSQFYHKLELDQKVLRGKTAKKEKSVCFIVKDYPLFNEPRALRSICKKHFQLYYCHPKTATKIKAVPKIKIDKSKRYSEVIRETLNLFARRTINLPTIKTGPEKIPYAIVDYEKHKEALSSDNLVNIHLQFLKDLQNIFGSCANNIASRQDMEHILRNGKEASPRKFIKPNIFTEKCASHVDKEEEEELDLRKSSVQEGNEIAEQEAQATEGLAAEETKHESRVEGYHWDEETAKKASYIILRFLKNMATMKFLSSADVLSEGGSQSEGSISTIPWSLRAQLTPLLALKSTLAKKSSEKCLLPALLHLKKSAKQLYNKVKSKEKSLIHNRLKELNKTLMGKSGISMGDINITDIISDWDSEIIRQDENSLEDEELFADDSDKSVLYKNEPDIFDYPALVVSNKRTLYTDLFCILLLFLSVSDKILYVRKSAREYLHSQLEKKEKKKYKKKDRTISLPHFRKFLKKENPSLDVNTYIAVAQRYCPDYVFYEKKHDLKAQKAEVVRSSDEIVPPQPEESKIPGMMAEGEEQVEEEQENEKVYNSVEEEESREAHRSTCLQFEEANSYMSWKSIEEISNSVRLYFIKHSIEWEPYKDISDFGIDKAFKSTDFFEFPSTMHIPKIVTEYHRTLPNNSFILDPSPNTFKWIPPIWTRDPLKINKLDKLDEDLSWKTKYFTTFWISEGDAQYSWEELQKLIFATWCGDNQMLYDETANYFDKFSEAIDNFEQEHRKTRKIYDHSDKVGSRRKWFHRNAYLENRNTIMILGIRDWVKKLQDIYKEVETPSSGVSITSSKISFQSAHKSISSRRISASVADLNSKRNLEKADCPTGFPLKDQKSLEEALTNFVKKTSNFRSHRISVFGENYRPITEYYLQQLNEECGYVYTHARPEDHPNARYAPPRAIFYSEKEKQFYHHSNNFIDFFQKKYPQRFLKMPYHVMNEYGSMKHICTFVSPRRLTWPQMDTWKGCMRCVCNKLDCIKLNDAYRPPRTIRSPYTTLKERNGNVFELSILLTGFLIGAGYDAYCVCGTASYHRAYYCNTDDVEPDQSDMEAPSTNRYKQYNLLPPFSSKWLRNTQAYKDPIPYEDLEISKVKQKKKDMQLEEMKKWPTTEIELLSQYNKVTTIKINHKSRFNNPAIPLPETEEKGKVKKRLNKAGDHKEMNLANLYDVIIEELMRRSAEEQSELRTVTSRSYIHEPPPPIKSTYQKVKAKLLREDRAKRRKREKLQSTDKDEDYEYFDWLYGPDGKHQDFHQIYIKEKERMENKLRQKNYETVNLIEFLEQYNSKTDRLEIMTGQQLRFYKQDGIRCHKKLRKVQEVIRMKDNFKLSRKKIKKNQEKMIKKNKSLLNKDFYNFPRDSEILTPLNYKKGDPMYKKAHKYKLRNSPFIAKILLGIQDFFENKKLFVRIIEKLGFCTKLPREESRDSGVFEVARPEIYSKWKSERTKRREILKLQERRTLMSGPYTPSRLHCWVLVREGPRDVKESFFIDVATGCHYPTNDKNYFKISCAWNHLNYYIPRSTATYHTITRKFQFEDLKTWFHLLPLEPGSAVKEMKKMPWWWEAKGHPHILQHIRMPPYWGRRVRIPALEWDKKFAKANKKTFYYKKTIIEVYDADGRPTDGLEKRISKFFDMQRTILKEVSTKFSRRKDCLIWREVDINTGVVEERFEEGRPDKLKLFRYLAYLIPGVYTPKEFNFYGKWRKDKLNSILVTKKYIQAEFREGRIDHLKRIKFTYAKDKSRKRFPVLDEYSNYIKRIRARFRKLSFNFEMWKESLPDLFADIPRKLDINMVFKYSEYWYWDETLQTDVKWRANHPDGDLAVLMNSQLNDNPLILKEPLLYGITCSLEDTPRQLTLRKEKYAKREKKDREYLMRVARELEETIADTVVLREYEKVKDVLKETDELNKTNILSENQLNQMRRYFEVEREMLARDYKKMTETQDIWNLWTCEEDTLTGQLLNHFIKEQFWLFFILGGWDDMNKIYKRILKERENCSPLFSGYKDLLRTLLEAFNQGFKLTEATFPLPIKRNVDLWTCQIQVPMSIGLQRLNNITLNSDNVEDNPGQMTEEEAKKNLTGSTRTTIPKDGCGKSSSLLNKSNFVTNTFLENHIKTKDVGNKSLLQIACCNTMNKEVNMKDNSIASSVERRYKIKQNFCQTVNEANQKEKNKLVEDGSRSGLSSFEKSQGKATPFPEKDSITGKRKKYPPKHKGLDTIEKDQIKKKTLKSIQDHEYNGKTTKDGTRNNTKLQKNAKEKPSCSDYGRSQCLTKDGLEPSQSNLAEPSYSIINRSNNRSKKANFVYEKEDIDDDIENATPHCTVDMNEYAFLRSFFLQITKILSTSHIKEMLSMKKHKVKLAWNEGFIDFFNNFVVKIVGEKNKTEEDEMKGFVDTRYPVGYHIKPAIKEVEILKKLNPANRLSVEGMNLLINIFQKCHDNEPLEEEEKKKGAELLRQIQDHPFVKSKEFKNIIKKLGSAKVTDASKSKPVMKATRHSTFKFTFENNNDTEKERERVDYYKMFSKRYKTVSKSFSGLQEFLNELEYRPRISYIVKHLYHTPRKYIPSILSFDIYMGKYYPESKRHFSVETSDEELHIGAERRVFKGYELMGSNDNSKLYDPNLRVKKYIDVGVVEAINLFSRPSELEFIQRKDKKNISLQLKLRENEIQIFDAETIKRLQCLFPIDYRALDLYNQIITSDGVLDFKNETAHRKGGSINDSIGTNHKDKYHSTVPKERLTLRKEVESCPHCIKTFYLANKDRRHFLQIIEQLRNDNIAHTLTLVDGSPLPENLLEIYQRSIKTYGDYVSLLEDSEPIYTSYKNKIACEECRQFKYFLELLNYKVMYDYFDVSLLFRKHGRTGGLLGVLESGQSRKPIPFYHSHLPSAERISLTSFLKADMIEDVQLMPVIEPPKFEETIQQPEAYPIVDESNTIQVELYRDIREKKVIEPKAKQTTNERRRAFTRVTKKVQRKL